MKKGKGVVPDFPADVKKLQPTDKAAWVGKGKKVYLTIDAGGPMGDTDKLLKAFKDNHAVGNFFIAGYNMKAYPDFIRKLAADGHIVANHTMTHKDQTTLSDEAVKKEIEDFNVLYKQITGKDVAPFYRFPYGTYNYHLMTLVSNMGYTSVFWSVAMRDWEPRAGGAEEAYQDVIGQLHDGAVILMHEGSEDNINALDRIIKEIQRQGYELAPMTDLAK